MAIRFAKALSIEGGARWPQSLRPIHDDQPGYPRKLPDVERHQRGTATSGLSRDQIIVGPDGRPLAFEVRADVASMSSVFSLERKYGDARRKKLLEQMLGLRSLFAARVAVAQFKKGDRGEDDLCSKPQLLGQTESHRRNAPVNRVDRNIGIQ